MHSQKQPNSFADLIEGNGTAIILNNTNIEDVNNTVLDSIDVNIKEDCMNRLIWPIDPLNPYGQRV